MTSVVAQYPINSIAASIPVNVPVGAIANPAIYIGVECGNSSDYMLAGQVLHNGVSLGAPLAMSPGNGTNALRVWRVVPQPNTTAAIVIAPSASAHLLGYVVLVDDVDQSTPNGTAVANPVGSNANNYSSISTSANSSPSGLVLDFVANRAIVDLTPGTGQTRVGVQQQIGTVATLSVSTKPGTGSAVAMQWTYPAGSPNMAQIVIPIRSATVHPTITGPSAVAVAEGVTACGSWTFDAPCTVALSGADAALFVAPASGTMSSFALALLAAPNFESPADAGADNTYNVTLTATSASGIASTLAITVTVTNTAPSWVGPAIGALTFVVGQPITPVPIAALFADPAGGAITGSIVELATPANGLSVSGGNLVGTPTAQATAVTFTPRGTDAAGAGTNGPTFTVTVQSAATYSAVIEACDVDGSGAAEEVGTAVLVLAWRLATGIESFNTPQLRLTATRDADTGVIAVTTFPAAGKWACFILSPGSGTADPVSMSGCIVTAA